MRTWADANAGDILDWWETCVGPTTNRPHILHDLKGWLDDGYTPAQIAMAFVEGPARERYSLLAKGFHEMVLDDPLEAAAEFIIQVAEQQAPDCYVTYMDPVGLRPAALERHERARMELETWTNEHLGSIAAASRTGAVGVNTRQRGQHRKAPIVGLD